MSPVPTGPNQPGGYASPAMSNVPVAAEVRSDLPTRVIIEQNRSGKFWSRLPWILLGLSLLFVFAMFSQYQSYFETNPPIEEKYHSLSKVATDKIAIIAIEGTIMHTDGFAKWQIDRVRDDENVKAVILRVDSPGGTITGSHYLYHHLVRLTKEKNIPLVVSMGGLAASGGYYVSMAVGTTPDTIFAEPTTWTGSIGVIIPHYDVSELLEKWNIKDDSIASNPLKMMGSPTRKDSPEIEKQEHDILENLVQQSFEDFKAIVRSGRPALAKDDKTLDKAATGQIFTAKQAMQLGLVDKLGFIEDAIDRALVLASLERDDVRVVKYDKPKTLFGDVFSPMGQQQGNLNLGAILDLTSPRAYYLCTWLPGVVTSGGPR